MLKLMSDGVTRNCKGLSRREFLRVGSLGLGGLSLSQLLATQARAEGRRMVKDKAVVMLFLQGGPSQIETFDPKMTAPAEIRSITGEVATKLPGITFGSSFPKLAARADRLAVVRSFASGNADHQDYVRVAGGDNPLKTPMGTLYARIAGPNHPRTGLPTNIILPAEAVSPGLRLPGNFETQSLQKLVSTSHLLGANYGFFDPSGGGELRQNLELRIPQNRLTERRNLLTQLDTKPSVPVPSRTRPPTTSKRTTCSCAASPRRSISIAKIAGCSIATTRAACSRCKTSMPGATCGARRICSANRCCSRAAWLNRVAASSP